MSVFRFKQFWVVQQDNAMKVGTDAMLLGSFIDVQKKKFGLDIGAGTGVLSLMVAQRNADICIDGVELDELSAGECGINFEKSPWSDRLKSHHASFTEFESGQQYDLIFSNPPYYQTRLQNQDKRKAKARHEESLPMRDLIRKSENLLSSEGHLWLIVPYENEIEWLNEAEQNGLHLEQRVHLIGKIGGELKRSILCFGRHLVDIQTRTFYIRDENGSYTDEYRSLTKDYHFHLKER